MQKQRNTLYASPFCAGYWKSAASELKKGKVLTIAALFIAIEIVISSFFIPVGENLRIYFSFFVKALGALIYGPVIGLISGFVSDILGYFLHPSGAYFPGYTLTSMLGLFIYALFFYRARITVLRIFLCKTVINFGLNVALGSVWSSILFGKGYLYFLVKSLIKNALLLPLEVIVLVLFFQLMLPVAGQSLSLPAQRTKHIPFF